MQPALHFGSSSGTWNGQFTPTRGIQVEQLIGTHIPCFSDRFSVLQKPLIAVVLHVDAKDDRRDRRCAGMVLYDCG
jgi:hypothetical protein